jgi:hypothetical protein
MLAELSTKELLGVAAPGAETIERQRERSGKRRSRVRTNETSTEPIWRRLLPWLPTAFLSRLSS